MRARFAILGLLSLLLTGCLRYEYEHEFWLKVNGSGVVHVTAQPWLWNAFKGVGSLSDPESTVTPEIVQDLFTRAGLRVRRVTLVRRDGRPYIFIAAEFDDISRLGGTRAFPDLNVRLVPDGDRLRLEGTWRQPEGARHAERDTAGLMAVRFHLPAKVYSHRNAAAGVERGNIVSWRQDVGAALRGQALEMGVLMDQRSILWSTVALFGLAIAGAVAMLLAILYVLSRKGRAAKAN
jgi:hypothetical protein